MISVIIVVAITPLFSMMIWFERLGHNNFQTLVNHLFSFLCWILMLYLLVAKNLDILLAYLGPFPTQASGLKP